MLEPLAVVETLETGVHSRMCPMPHALNRAAVLPAVGLRGLAPQDAARSYRDVLVRAPHDNGGEHSQRRTTPLARKLMAFAAPSLAEQFSA